MSVAARRFSFGAGDPGNGMLLTPLARWAYRSSAAHHLGLRDGASSSFFGRGGAGEIAAPHGVQAGLLSEAHAALVGWAYRLNPWSTRRCAPARS